jgi:hypothetical protein
METLFKQVDALTAEEVKQLYLYICDHYQTVVEAEVIGKPLKKRILGLHAHLGSAWMSEDFDGDLVLLSTDPQLAK